MDRPEKYILVRISDDSAFDGVFGADCFRKNFPELYTSGVLLRQFGPDGWWYTWDKEQDWMHDETSFFTKEDLKRLEIIGEIQ